MKSFFRNITTVGALSAIFAVSSFAQTTTITPTAPAGPCEDAAAIIALDTQIRDLQKKTADLPSYKGLIEASKQYIEKYGDCKNDQVVLVSYLNKQIKVWEEGYAARVNAIAIKPFLDKFDAGLKSKNWDDVYAGGKGLIDANIETYRPALLVMGSIGLDETAKSPRVTKWNDQTIQYAKRAIADLEANKKFEAGGKDTYGYSSFTYKNREDALGWMNYTIGYILAYDKKNLKEAAPYLYKATQVNSDTKSNDVVFAALGDVALDEYNNINKEIEALKLTQAATDTDEVKQEKIDQLKAKAALSLGAAERVLDYYSRAYSLAKAKDKPNTAALYKLVQQLYERRFDNTNGLDAWIAARSAQPVPNPSNAVQPVVEGAPTASVTPGAGSPPVTVVPVTVVKPAAPAAKPVSNPVTRPGKSAAAKTR